MIWPNVARAYAQAYEDIRDIDRAVARNRAMAQLDLAAIQLGTGESNTMRTRAAVAS